MIIANYLYRTWEKFIFGVFLLLLGCSAAQMQQQALAADAPAGKPVTTLSATLSPFSTATGAEPPKPWRAVGLPKGKAPLTRMDMATLEGERVLRLATDKSYGTLSHALPALALGPQATLRWKWRVDQGIPAADLRRKEGDDSPLRVCALFDLPLDNLGLMERTVMRIARSTTGEALPAATLCYVWDTQLPTGTLLPNPYTRRVRFMVLNSGDSPLGTWVSHERKLSADFLRAFKSDMGGDTGKDTGKDAGEAAAPDTARLPPLVAIVVGADSDNTGGTSLSYIGDVLLKP
jgi:Protein of unknown function (DUF3047)